MSASLQVPPARAQLAYESLLAAIRAGQLAAGARLREADVAHWLQISRTPVREALRRLEAEGLLTHLPHVGVVVTEINAEMVGELYAMREVLEGAAAALAAQHASAAELARLMAMLKGERALGADAAALARHNREFHGAIYAAAHNRYLSRSLGALHDTLLLGKTTLGSPERAAKARAEHAAIVRAIAARRPPEAEARMRAHIRGAYRERMSLLFAGP